MTIPQLYLGRLPLCEWRRLGGRRRWGGSITVREVLIFFDRPAEQVVAAAAEFLARPGVRISHLSAYSVAFVAADGQADDGGQVAAVPVQLKPDWCRVWVSIGGAGVAAA